MIQSQSTIAHYRVETLIGAGGMGEIYKAVDSRLGRSVALKILPPDLSHSRERIRRFLHEAKAASSLNHPNILTVYDAGEAEVANGSASASRVHFIATELVEGSTLRDLIHRDKLPLKRIVGYLAQAADGLAKAHAAGIVHRDLKPDNIMVTADGFAKVLDFGLAKLIEARDEQSTAADPTREGLILGTVRYMSPEQAQGKPVDHRSDIFAFGAILYEAAARQPAFHGNSDPDILHRIIYEEPEPVPNVPVDLHRVLTRAMAKDPDERLQSMKDLALELRDISRSFDDLKIQKRVRKRIALRSGGWAAMALAALIVGVVAGRLAYRAPRSEDPVAFSIVPPENTAFAATPNSATALQFAVSPNGRSIAFLAASTGSLPRIWIRDLGSVSARPLAGTDGAWFPFWSPNSDAIAFFAGGKLKRIAVNGGAPMILADAIDPRGGSWSKDDVILFAPGGGAVPLMRIPAEGGEPTPATMVHSSEGEAGHRWPSFLADGKHFLYYSFGTGRFKQAVYAGTLGSPDAEFVTHADSRAEYAGNGRIVFMRKGSLYVQRIDEGTLRTIGEPVLVERQVGFASPIFYGAFSASQTNVIAWAPWVNPNRKLTWLDRNGNITGTVFEPADWGTASLTLLGDRAVLTRSDPDTANLDLWMVDLTRGVGSHLTTNEADDNHPVWIPGGQSVVFTSTRSGRSALYLKTLADQREEILATSIHVARPTGSTPDGRYLVYYDRSPDTASDIWLLPLAPKGSPQKFIATPAAEWGAVVSPDGKWIAYASDESGRDEIYVQPFPSGGNHYRVSVDGGATAKWSPDGRELFFMTPNAEMASVEVKPNATRFECTVPKIRFRVPGIAATHPAFQTDYAVAADGRFLIALAPPDRTSAPIQMTVNWQPR